MDFWIWLYNQLGITDFIYYISSPQLQDYLFPVKLIFVTCGMFFLAFVIYFMINSSWLQFNVLQDTSEFFSWQAYGAREMTKRLAKIRQRIQSGLETDFKLAIIDADDIFQEVLDKRGYEGKDFNELVQKASKMIASQMRDILNAHEVRNNIVFNPDYKVSQEEAKRILDVYESAINNIGLS